MDSRSVKLAFAEAGIRVRVADLGQKFRICTLSGEALDTPAAIKVAASLRLTCPLGNPGGSFNQEHEMIAYKPGAVRRIQATTAVETYAYSVDGERLTLAEIRARLPHISPEIVRRRVNAGLRTWAELGRAGEEVQRAIRGADQPPEGRPMIWTEEDDAELLRLRGEGLTIKAIAARMGRGVSAIRHRSAAMVARGRVERLQPPKRRWTTVEELQMKQLVARGIPYEEIGLRLNRSTHAIKTRACECGAPGPHRNYTTTEIAMMRRLLAAGKSTRVIALTLKRPYQGMKEKIRQLGLRKELK